MAARLIPVLLLLVALALPAAEPAPSNSAGEKLAAKLRALAPGENAEIHGVFNLRPPGRDDEQVPLITKVVKGSNYWEAIYKTGKTSIREAEQLIIRHSPAKLNEYRYGRGAAAEAPAPLGRDKIATPLGGSDFWVMDLGLEFLHWPAQRLIKKDPPVMRKGRPCDLLESRTPNPPPGSYARVTSYVDKETGGLIIAESFDDQGKLMKAFSVRSFKKVEGEWQLQEMEMKDHRVGSRTRIDFDVENGKDK